MGSPKMTCEDELTMMSMKRTMENVGGQQQLDASHGMRNLARCCGTMHTVRTHPRDVVAEACVMSVAMLLMQDIRLAITAQLRSPPSPCNVEGWRTIEPTPLARTMHQIR